MSQVIDEHSVPEDNDMVSCLISSSDSFTASLFTEVLKCGADLQTVLATVLVKKKSNRTLLPSMSVPGKNNALVQLISAL